MAANQVTIQLTPQQQHQIRIATGKSLTELNIDLSAIHFALPDRVMDKIEFPGRVMVKMESPSRVMAKVII